MATLEGCLLASVEYDTNGPGCWLWSGPASASGYGLFPFEGRYLRAHRVAYQLWCDQLSPQVPNVCHHCDTPACIRPDHLYAGSQAENVADRVRRGRDGRAKLRAADIPIIRARLAAGDRPIDIAEDYGVHNSTIYQIENGRTWRHVASE